MPMGVAYEASLPRFAKPLAAGLRRTSQAGQDAGSRITHPDTACLRLAAGGYAQAPLSREGAWG